jgi:hypothetical protein
MAEDCNNPPFQSPLNIAAPDKFILIVELPPILRKRASSDKRYNAGALQIMLKNSVLPAVVVPAIDLGFQGQRYNVSSHSRPNYNPLNVEMFVDNQFNNYWILWQWLNVLNTSMTSIYDGTPTNEMYKEMMESGATLEYQSNLVLQILDEYNNKIIQFKYTDAFPISLGAIALNYQTPGQISVPCDFQFNRVLLD